MATLEQLTELETLNRCAYECTRQSHWKESTQRYLANLLPNNIRLQEDVLSHSYRIMPTTNFTLNERGKIRKIEAPAMRDRIIQKALMKQVLSPSIIPCLIYDNYASVKNRGTSFARKRFEIMLRRYYAHNGLDGYILLIDIKKYFENIDHEVLKQLLAPRLVNEPQETIDLIFYLIDRSSHSHRGLNLGSEAPQIDAIYYLGVIDIFVKVVKAMKYYGRYMDDIFIIDKDKKRLQALLKEIEGKLAKLKLTINAKKTHIVKLTHGFTFLQIKYNMKQGGKILKRPSHGKIVRERRRLKAFRREMDKGNMTLGDVWNCYHSWRGSIIKDHNAHKKSIASLDALYASLFPPYKKPRKMGRKEIIGFQFREADTRDLKYCLMIN